jgi:hypothetical protein
MMDTVQVPRSHEPPVQPLVFLEPESLHMHDVMQITEHQEAPGQAGGEEDQLVKQRDMQQVENR